MQRLKRCDAVALFQSTPLSELQSMAQLWRNQHNPAGRVTFVLDTNPNYSNVCHADCTFCSFYRKPGDPQSYTKTVDQVMSSFELAQQAGLTTVLLQGGLHPELPLSYYVELVATARKRFPQIHCHFFSAPEIYNIARTNQLSYTQVLSALYEAGQRTLPGGGAEILSERVRRRLSPKKMEPGAWIAIHRTAHQIGMRSTATMMYGHLETAEDLVEHLELLRQLQDETAGFTAFIPWSYKPGGNALGRRIQGWAGPLAYFRILAFSRLYLDNFAHIQASWFSEGKSIGVQALHYGADDFGGLILEEQVHRATNFINKSSQREIIEMIHQAGFDALERDPLYQPLRNWPRQASAEVAELPKVATDEPSLSTLGSASDATLKRWAVIP